MADDSGKAIRKLRTVLAAFAPPGLPSPEFIRRAAELEQTLQWCEQRPDDPLTAEILRRLLIEAGLLSALSLPNPLSVPLPPVESYPLPAPDPPLADLSPPPVPIVVSSPLADLPSPGPQCPEPAPSPKPVRRDRAKRKHAAVQEIARRVFPPDGKVPPKFGTAQFKRDHVDKTWEVVAPTYGLAGSPSPDWHTINRAIGRAS